MVSSMCCGDWWLPAAAVAFLLLTAAVTTATPNSTVAAAAAEVHPRYYTFYVSPSRITWSGGGRERAEAERTGAYVPRNVLFTKVRMLGTTAFVLSPRYRPGVPFTVGHFDVADPKQSLEPYVKPFPSAALHDCGRGDGPECLANAVDFALDDSGVLWVLDVGTVHTYGSEPLTVGPPKIWGLDGITGEVRITRDITMTDASTAIISLSVYHYNVLSHIIVEYISRLTFLHSRRTNRKIILKSFFYNNIVFLR